MCAHGLLAEPGDHWGLAAAAVMGSESTWLCGKQAHGISKLDDLCLGRPVRDIQVQVHSSGIGYSSHKRNIKKKKKQSVRPVKQEWRSGGRNAKGVTEMTGQASFPPGSHSATFVQEPTAERELGHLARRPTNSHTARALEQQ